MDVLEGDYLGKPTIKVGDLDIPGNLYKKVSVKAVDDSTISLSMKKPSEATGYLWETSISTNAPWAATASTTLSTVPRI